MRRTILVAMFLCASVFSQGQSNRTVLDSYYGDYLVYEDSQQVVSSKINYPGLFNDSISTIDIGFTANPYYYGSDNTNLIGSSSTNLIGVSNADLIGSSGANLQLQNLNGWGEKRNRFGKIGGWIGYIGFANSASKNSSENEYSYFTGSSAFWYAPYYKSVFRGVSLSLGGSYYKNSHNLVETSINNTSSSNNSSNSQSIDVGLNALFQCNERFQVAIHLFADQSNNLSNNGSTSEYTYTNYDYYSNYSYNYINKSGNSYRDTSKFQNCGIGVTVLDNKRRQFSANVNANRDNHFSTQNNYNSRNGYDYYNYNSSTSYDTGNGDVTASLAYSDTKVFKYLKHRAYFGINAFASFDFPVNSESYLSYNKLIKGVHLDQYLMNCAIYVPVTIDLNVFNTPLYIVAKITPEIYSYVSKNYYSQNTTSNNISASVYETAIGIKGKIGNKLECAMIPSIKSNVFMAGMELKYNFGGKKENKKVL